MMNNVQFKLLAPDINEINVRKGAIWRVCHHNPGGRRFSAQLVAIVTRQKNEEGEEVPIIILESTQEEMTPEQFEDYRRRTWPLEHENGRNPNNVTLGVQSGTAGTKGGL